MMQTVSCTMCFVQPRHLVNLGVFSFKRPISDWPLVNNSRPASADHPSLQPAGHMNAREAKAYKEGTDIKTTLLSPILLPVLDIHDLPYFDRRSVAGPEGC
jgi:hypothetical protein